MPQSRNESNIMAVVIDDPTKKRNQYGDAASGFLPPMLPAAGTSVQAPAGGYAPAQTPNAVRYEQPPVVPLATQPIAPVAPVVSTPALDAIRAPGAGTAVGQGIAKAAGFVGNVLAQPPVDPMQPIGAGQDLSLPPPPVVLAPGGATQAQARAVDNAAAAPVIPAPVAPVAPVAAAPVVPTPDVAAQDPTAAGPVPAPTTTPSSDPTVPNPGDVTRVGNSYSGTNVSGPISINGTSTAPGGAPIVANPGGPVPGAPAGFVPGPNVPKTPLADAVIAATMNPQAAGVNAAGPDPQLAKDAAYNRNRTQYLMEQAINHGFSTRKGNSNDAIISALAGQLNTQDSTAGRLQENTGTNATNANIAGFREGGENTRTGLTQTGENARAAARDAGETARANLREAGETTRNAGLLNVAQGRLGVEQADLGLRSTAAGFQNAAARRLEAAQVELSAAKTPDAIHTATAKIMALQGKEPAPKFTVVPGGQTTDAAGIVHTLPSQVIENATGRFITPPGGGGAAAPAIAEGSMSKTGDGKPIKYVGGKWVPA